MTKKTNSKKFGEFLGSISGKLGLAVSDVWNGFGDDANTIKELAQETYDDVTDVSEISESFHEMSASIDYGFEYVGNATYAINEGLSKVTSFISKNIRDIAKDFTSGYKHKYHAEMNECSESEKCIVQIGDNHYSITPEELELSGSIDDLVE